MNYPPPLHSCAPPLYALAIRPARPLPRSAPPLGAFARWRCGRNTGHRLTAVSYQMEHVLWTEKYRCDHCGHEQGTMEEGGTAQ